MRRAVRWGLIVILVSGIAAPGPVRAASEDDDAPDAVKVTVIGNQKPEDPVISPSARPAVSNCNLATSSDAANGEAIVRKIAMEERFDSDLVLAIARQESGFRVNSVSSAGAIGLMQLMPATAKRFGVDVCDPEDNVRGAIRFLRLLQKKYQNPLYVLAAYNAGEGAVEQNRGIPLYPETVRYVSAVLTDLYGWKPLGNQTAMGRTDDTKPVTADNEHPQTWTEGFVLHVE